MARRVRLAIAVPIGYEPPPPKKPGSLFMADNYQSEVRKDIHLVGKGDETYPRSTRKNHSKDTEYGYEPVVGRNEPYCNRGMPPPSGNRFKTADEGDD